MGIQLRTYYLREVLNLGRGWSLDSLKFLRLLEASWMLLIGKREEGRIGASAFIEWNLIFATV